MRIALDIRMINHSGIGTYVQGLLEGFERFKRGDLELVLIGRRDAVRSMEPELGELQFVEYGASIYGLWEQLSYPLGKIRECNLLHYPHYNIPLRYNGKLVLTIHDINHYIFPENLPSVLHRLYARYFYRQAVSRAEHIIAISPRTKEDLISHLGAAEEKISVIPYGMTEKLKAVRDTEIVEDYKRSMSLPGKYLLAVSINKPHKNYEFLLKVLSSMWKRKSLDMPLVICGTRKGKRKNLEVLIESLEVKDRIIFLEYLTKQDLHMVYAGAEALIFPSLYEGFGMPPLEAMKAGTAVLASVVEPIKYVTGDAALHFDPRDEKGLEHCIHKILIDRDLRLELIERGYKNLERFSWVKNAEETLEIYERVIKES